MKSFKESFRISYKTVYLSKKMYIADGREQHQRSSSNEFMFNTINLIDLII